MDYASPTSRAVLAGKRRLNKYAVANPATRMRRKALLVVCGLLVGAVNGLFGAGGGMLAVPVLSYVAGLNAQKSHATAIAVILPLCIISSVAYAATGTFDYSVFPPTVIGVVAGGVIGALALKKLSGVFIDFLFYALMLFAGLKMLF